MSIVCYVQCLSVQCFSVHGLKQYQINTKLLDTVQHIDVLYPWDKDKAIFVNLIRVTKIHVTMDLLKMDGQVMKSNLITTIIKSQNYAF